MSGKFKIIFKKQEKTLELKQLSLFFAGLELKYTDIISQFVNVVKDGGRILLKITCEQKSYTLEFSSIEDRQVVQDTIAKELGKRTTTAPSSAVTNAQTDQIIKAKTHLLSSNPSLLHLHKELVIGQLISEEEFWSTRQDLFQNELFVQNQVQGVSSVSLMSLLPDSSVEGADIKYTLNPEIIRAIFAQYPGVHKAYQHNVPDKLSEKEFWTAYFSSKYFHRNRTSISSQNDIFQEYMQQDLGSFV
jgi:transcription initiation factor TFIIH subunit 1